MSGAACDRLQMAKELLGTSPSGEAARMGTATFARNRLRLGHGPAEILVEDPAIGSSDHVQGTGCPARSSSSIQPLSVPDC